MYHTLSDRWRLIALGVSLAALAWPPLAAGQNARGQARAVQAVVAGAFGTTTTALADTGTFGDSNDAREASQLTGDIPSLLTASVLHATAIGWPDQVDSEASLADLVLIIAGTTIGADFIQSRAQAIQGAGGAGAVSVEDLSINGLPIAVAGNPNETILIPGGRVVINEQQTTATGAVVNALHVIVYGVADVVIGSATAQLQ